MNSIVAQLHEHRTTTAAEAADRDKAMLADYRRLLGVAEPTAEDVAALDDLMTRLRLDPADLEVDQQAMTRAGELHAEVNTAAARWKTVEAALGKAQMELLRLIDPAERAMARERERTLEIEQVELARTLPAAAAEITRLRRDHPRVADVIDQVPAEAIPTSALKSSPVLIALLGAATLAFGDDNAKSQYLRYRGAKAQAIGWVDPIVGNVTSLGMAFKQQISLDLAPARELLGLLAGLSSFH